MEDYALLNLLDEHKASMPDRLYMHACNLLKKMHEDNNKEVVINAISAECIAQAYYADDDTCVAYKVSQRPLRVKCTPISDAEARVFRSKSPTEILQLGRYRPGWLTEYRDGEYNKPILKESFPIIIEGSQSSQGSGGIAITSVERIDTNKRARK